MDNQTRINKRQGDSFVLFSSFQNQSAVWFIAKALGIWKSTRKETSFSPNGYVTAEDMIHCDPVEFSQQTDFLKELLIIKMGSSPIPTFILEWVNIGARFMVTEMVMWSSLTVTVDHPIQTVYISCVGWIPMPKA